VIGRGLDSAGDEPVEQAADIMTLTNSEQWKKDDDTLVYNTCYEGMCCMLDMWADKLPESFQIFMRGSGFRDAWRFGSVAEWARKHTEAGTVFRWGMGMAAGLKTVKMAEYRYAAMSSQADIFYLINMAIVAQKFRAGTFSGSFARNFKTNIGGALWMAEHPIESPLIEPGKEYCVCATEDEFDHYFDWKHALYCEFEYGVKRDAATETKTEPQEWLPKALMSEHRKPHRVVVRMRKGPLHAGRNFRQGEFDMTESMLRIFVSNAVPKLKSRSNMRDWVRMTGAPIGSRMHGRARLCDGLLEFEVDFICACIRTDLEETVPEAVMWDRCAEKPRHGAQHERGVCGDDADRPLNWTPLGQSKFEPIRGGALVVDSD